MADFTIRDAIDPSIISKLNSISAETSKMSEQFDTALEKYSALATKMAQGLGLKPQDLQGLGDKAANYEQNLAELVKTQEQLNKLQKEHAELLKRVQTEESEAVKSARERAAITKANNEAEQAELKTKQEQIRLQKMQNSQDKTVRHTKEEIIELMKEDVKTINQANKMNKALRAAVKDLNVENENERKLLEEINKRIAENTKFIRENSDAYTQQKMNVGNYTESIKAAFSDMASGNITLSNLTAMAEKTGEMFKGGLKEGLAVATQGVKAFGQQMLTLLANPIIATIAAIAAVIMTVKKAIDSDNEALQTWQRVLAPVNGVLQVMINIVQKVAEKLLLLAEGFINTGTAIAKWMEKIPFIGDSMKTVNKSIEDNVKATKLSQQVEEKKRDMIGKNAEINKRVAELNRKVAQTETVSAKEREAAMKEIDKLQKGRMKNNVEIAKMELEAFRLSHENSKNTREELDEQARLEAAVTEAETEYLKATQKNVKRLDSLHKEQNRNAEKSKEYRLKLQELENEAMESLVMKGLEHDIAAIKKGYAKKLAEIKGNTEEEIRIRIMLNDAMEKEINDKATEYYYKNATEMAELRKAVAKEQSDEELRSELEILQYRYEQEIIAAQNNHDKVLLITEKYEKLQRELMEKATDARIKKYQENVALEAAYRDDAMNKEVNDVRKMYAKREITEEEMNARLAEIQEKYAIKSAQAAINALETQLSMENLSADEREKLEEQLAQKKIGLEKVVTDAVINGNKRQSESYKKVLAEVEKYVSFAGDMLNGITSLGSQLYENQLAKLDEMKEALDNATDEEMNRIDEMEQNGSISAEEAEARKRAAKDKSEKQAEEIARKQEEIQKKQARLEKANALAQAIISTALAITKALPNFILAGMAGAMGALQIATISATPVAAYAKGTDDHKGGLAVVGDGGRKELVIVGSRAYVTPDTPTLVDLPRHAKVLPDAESLQLDRIGSDLTTIMKEREMNGLQPVIVSNDFSTLETRLDSVANEVALLRKLQQKNFRSASMSNYINSRM